MVDRLSKLRRVLRAAELGSSQLLDAAESSVDRGMSGEEFDRVMESRVDEDIFDLTGEVMGWRYWRLAAGEPNLKNALWPTVEYATGGQIGSHISRANDEYLLCVPSAVEDRHRGNPERKRGVDAA